MSPAAHASAGRVPAATLAPLLRRAGIELDAEVHGASMQPGLPPGSHLHIACGATDWHRGDIVAIAADPPVSHRVVRVVVRGGRRYVITRGDATWFCDLPVVEQELLGLVTAARPAGGEWGAPPPPVVRRGMTRFLALASEHAVWAAMHVGDRLTSRVVRAGQVLATRRR
jgi:hypothetical protein